MTFEALKQKISLFQRVAKYGEREAFLQSISQSVIKLPEQVITNEKQPELPPTATLSEQVIEGTPPAPKPNTYTMPTTTIVGKPPVKPTTIPTVNIVGKPPQKPVATIPTVNIVGQPPKKADLQSRIEAFAKEAQALDLGGINTNYTPIAQRPDATEVKMTEHQYSQQQNPSPNTPATPNALNIQNGTGTRVNAPASSVPAIHSDPWVKNLQEGLIKTFGPGILPRYGADGKMGDETRKAIAKIFQNNGTTWNGKLDEQAMSVLGPLVQQFEGRGPANQSPQNAVAQQPKPVPPAGQQLPYAPARAVASVVSQIHDFVKKAQEVVIEEKPASNEVLMLEENIKKHWREIGAIARWANEGKLHSYAIEKVEKRLIDIKEMEDKLHKMQPGV
jgi:hypothetical protein